MSYLQYLPYYHEFVAYLQQIEFMVFSFFFGYLGGKWGIARSAIVIGLCLIIYQFATNENVWREAIQIAGGAK